jgi:hypothetical protein
MRADHGMHHVGRAGAALVADNDIAPGCLALAEIAVPEAVDRFQPLQFLLHFG